MRNIDREVKDAEPTVIVRVPQPDNESPWTKMGTRHPQQMNVQSQVQRSPSNGQAYRSVIDLLSEQGSVHHGGNPDPASGATRILGKAPLGVITLEGWLVALSGSMAGESWGICSGKRIPFQVSTPHCGLKSRGSYAGGSRLLQRHVCEW